MPRPALWMAAAGATAFIIACGYSYVEGTYFPKTWQTDLVEVSACAETEHPRGGFQKVLMTPKAAAQFKAKQYPIAQGEVVVKVQYKSDETCTGSIDIWTVMKKGPKGTAPKSGDWEWQTIWSTGKIGQKGQIDFCIDCHEGCGGDTDYLCTE